MEKIKNYLKKSMFERSNGVDIDKLSTSELIRQVKLIPVLFIIVIVCAVLIVGFGALIVGVMVADGDFEGALIALLFLAFGIPCAFLAFIFPKRLKNVKIVLDSREVDTKIQEAANQKLAETKKYACVGAIVLIALMLFITMKLIFNEPPQNLMNCKRCGCETIGTDGYRYCSDCYGVIFDD